MARARWCVVGNEEVSDLWQLLLLMGAAVAAIFGASWAKKKIETRGAEKQRDAQQDEAERVETELHESDKAIDEEAAAGIAAIEARRAARHRAQVELGKRDPTPEEIERFIRESKE